MVDAAYERVMMAFGRDTTVRWPCRRGDFVLWLQPGSPLGRPSLDMPDFWEMRDGDFITITNRGSDLPSWFEVHPSEVRDALAHAVMDKLNAGWQPPDEPMDGPHLWRLRAGDRVVWVGDSRPGQEAANGILAILDFRECAIAIGETNRTGLLDFIGFGSLSTPELSPQGVRRCQVGVEAARSLGAPRNWSPEWSIG